MEEIEFNGNKYILKSSVKSVAPKGNESIVRCSNAGVHIGVVKSQEGQKVVLLNARRLWYWKGAFTLNQVATNGVDRKESRISCSVDEITLLDAIEIIPVNKDIDLSEVNHEVK